MGNEGGEATAPQPSPAETVTEQPAETATGQPAEVPRDPESTADDPVPRSVKAKTASEIDREGRPSHLKQKRKARSDTADISDQRSPEARSKAGKLARSTKADGDALSDPRSSSGSSIRRPRGQAEDSVRKPSRDRDASPSEAAKVTAREVPLPPRLPRAGRPVRTGVAQAGANAADETRSGDGIGQPASAKAVPSVAPAQAPEAAQADVPHPAKRTVATAASQPMPKNDTAPKGVLDDSVAARPAPLVDRNVAPAVDARQETSPAVPRIDDPHRVAPEAVAVKAKPAPDTRDVSPASGSQSPAGRAAAPRSGGDAIATGTASQAVMPVAAASGATGEAASKLPANIAVEPPAARVEPPVVAAPPPPSEARAVVPPSNPDKGAAQTAAPPPVAVKTGELAPKTPAAAPGQAATVVGASVTPPLFESTDVRAASDRDTPSAEVPPQAAVPPAAAETSSAAPKDAPTTPEGIAAVGTTGAPPPSERRVVGAASELDQAVVTGSAAPKDVPATPQSSAVVGLTAAPSPSEGRVGGPSSGPDAQVAGVSAPGFVPPLVAGSAAPKDAPTTPQGPAVLDTTAAPSLSEARAVEAASQPAGPPTPVGTPARDAPTSLANGPVANVGAVEGKMAAATDAARSVRNDAAQPAVASPGPAAAAVPGLPVPAAGGASVRDGGAPVTAMNEAQAPVSTQSPPTLPETARATGADHGGGAERPVSPASNLTKPSAVNGYGALGKIDNGLRAPSGEMASILMAPPAGPAPTNENPATLVKIAIGEISTAPEGTAIAYTITNPATAPVDLLFIRCNAVDRKGAVVGSAFDYVENIPAGQQVQRVVRMSSEVTATGQTFSCANDAATQ